MGIGNVQFLDNNGSPLTSGVLYSFQAGTSTQQATYTDSTGTVPNTNPIAFGSGARVSIWLTAGAFYKFVLCSQNDGAFCAPGDVLFSVDQVPGSGGSSSGGGAPFISNSANPATTGILRLASGDTICWRNTANSANLCIRKDATDVLSWDGGTIKFPETTCSNAALNFDYLCADSTAHRWKVSNNNGAQVQLVVSGVDINTSDQVTQLHFGSSAAPLGALPGTSQYLQWNGSQLIGNDPTITQYANDATTGTTNHKLATLVPGTANAVVAPSGTKAGVIGIVINGAGTSGTAGVQLWGNQFCVFDGSTTIGDYFTASSTVTGDCHDIGTSPGGLGKILTTNGGAGTQAIVVLLPSQAGIAGATRDFSVSGCAPPTSTDGSCTGTINISPALPDASYIPTLTLNANNGAFLSISINAALSASSIGYSITCTFNCSVIATPTIYVHLGWHTP